jgi:uncharacterized protein (DUF885 family)
MLETVKTFTALSEEFVEVHLRHDPVEATRLGLHDYDPQLPAHTPEALKTHAAWLRDLEQRLVASVPWDELPLEQRVEFALMRSRIASMRADLEEIKVPARNPLLYVETAIEGVYQLLARPFAPLEERKEAILMRLMEIPDYFARVQPNLTRVPELFAQTASEANAGGPTFVEEVVRTLLRAFPAENERIEHAGERARMGFLQFQAFLDGPLRERSSGTWAIGERWMNFKFEREHLLSMDCAWLDQLGRRELARVRGELEEEAKSRDATKEWREQIAEALERHPEPLRLLEAYTAEVERARRFVAEKRLVPIPQGRLETIETPPHRRAMLPAVGYLRAAPFDADSTGYFLVTPVNPASPRDDQARELGQHAYGAMTLSVLRETYPGRHLQFSHAHRAGSRLRRLAESEVFAEGWTAYAEDLMAEHGFFIDPATRLFLLRDQLLRACRLVVDIGLHTGNLGLDDASRYFRDHAALDAEQAVTEVRAAALHPTRGSCPIVGRTLMVELRDEVKRRLGSRFSLFDFHASLLKSGTIPPFLLREELWERLPQP